MPRNAIKPAEEYLKKSVWFILFFLSLVYNTFTFEAGKHKRYYYASTARFTHTACCLSNKYHKTDD